MKRMILFLSSISLVLGGCFLLPRNENHYDFLINRQFIEDDFEIIDGDFSALYPWERSGDVIITDSGSYSNDRHSYSGINYVNFNGDKAKLSLVINATEDSFISFYADNPSEFTFILDKDKYILKDYEQNKIYFYSLLKGSHSISWENGNTFYNCLDLVRIGQYFVFQTIDFEDDEEDILNKAYTYKTSDKVYRDSYYAYSGGSMSLCLESYEDYSEFTLLFKTTYSTNLSFFYLLQTSGKFICYLDDEVLINYSYAQNNNWIKYTSPAISPGEHSIMFRYHYFSYNYSNKDEYLYIDKIELTP